MKIILEIDESEVELFVADKDKLTVRKWLRANRDKFMHLEHGKKNEIWNAWTQYQETCQSTTESMRLIEEYTK